MRWHIKRLTAMIGRPIDVVWSFDLGNIYPLEYFQSSIRIFHPVDEPRNTDAMKAGEHSDIIFSVTNEILYKYRHLTIPRILVNHGVSEIFFQTQERVIVDQTLHIGLSGNLLRNDIDRDTLIRIIKENVNHIFEFWGSYSMMDANIGGGDDEATQLFVKVLSEMPNVKLHGAVQSEELAKGFARIDAFLICYDVLKDQSKGTNYHKVMEYLATGKPIIANNISAYQDTSNLVYMVKSRTSNAELPELFKTVIADMTKYNNKTLSQYRIEFARGNTYSRKIAEIEGHLIELL
jgi:glycosyltransferase involved in cell wall biosynthesis